MFELGQLRCFVAVAEELHFGRAAARLNITQPPLSRQIQLLEHVLEVRLFDRTSRSVMLTRAGQSFLPEARRLLRFAESAALAAKRTARGEAGTLNLGFTAASGYEFLPRLITSVRRQAPDIDLVLREMVSAEQIEGLVSGRIDAGLIRSPFNRREFRSMCVVREPLLLALPAQHPLAKAERVRLADLDQQNFIAYSPYEARYFYNLVGAIFAAAEISPVYVQYVSQIHSVLGLVKAGLGFALVPQAATNLGFDGVVLRDFENNETHIAELHLVWRPANTNPAITTLTELVLGQAA
ncbi:LysR substrate-binding domain-containing protein [Terrihabitans sp. B22-R8]|uniref:LysR substrate-binding domain-containing protein n=1 Tax=Terrihabitans sp. B22-R8 TaxID=3425128 RepID=UPI00403CB279